MLTDDTLPLTIRTPAGEVTVPLDVFAAREALSALAHRHPNPNDYTAAVRTWLTSQGVPAENLSAASVGRIVSAVADEVQRLREERSGLPFARLTRFYGVDVFALSPKQRFQLETAMPLLRAEEELASGTVEDNRLYDLVLLATGSKDAASAALEARVAERLRRGETPAI
jgi:hypothetical protein